MPPPFPQSFTYVQVRLARLVVSQVHITLFTIRLVERLDAQNQFSLLGTASK